MAATYGYGGEFSSDEDIDRMEHHSERMIQSKFDNYSGQSKPSKQAIEEAITAIKTMPLDQDITLTDELLAGLLDYYKTQRGPVVDSTRNLYKKIILRLIRGDKTNASSNGDSNSNGNNNNNNELNIISKRQQVVEAAASSDEDEPMPPASSQDSATESQQHERRKFDSRVVYDGDRLEPMEVDSETPAGTIRSNKNVDISSSSENDVSSETEEEDGEDSEDESSDSEELDITPVKERPHVQQQKAAGPKSSDMVKKPNIANVSVNEDAAIPIEAKKKPYTRSQRIAATRASSSSSNRTDVSSSKVETSAANVASTNLSGQKSKNFTQKYLILAVFIVMLAGVLFHFRSDLTKSTERILSKTIKF